VGWPPKWLSRHFAAPQPVGGRIEEGKRVHNSEVHSCDGVLQGGELDVAKIGSEVIPMLLHLRIVGRTHIRFVHVFYELVGILGSPKLLESRVGMERGQFFSPTSRLK